MKNRITAAAVLVFCAVFAGEYGVDLMGEDAAKEDISPLYLLAATTTTTVTTTNQLDDGSIQIIEKKITTISPEEEDYTSPEDGDYTYVEYEDAYVPYYKGYCYISGAWIWRGHGMATFPPPKFRPRPHQPHHHSAAPAKKAPVKQPHTKPAAKTTVKPAVKPAAKTTVKPAAKPASPRGGGRAPAGGPR